VACQALIGRLAAFLPNLDERRESFDRLKATKSRRHEGGTTDTKEKGLQRIARPAKGRS
jgi:hypothetical protein